MNKSLKSIENNEIVTKDSKQKPKQITLFDMKSKGKFSISSDNEFSPKPNSKIESRKKIKSDDDDIIIIKENEENLQTKAKNENSTKKINKKKDELNNSKIKDYFGQPANADIKIEEASNSDKKLSNSQREKTKSDDSNGNLEKIFKNFRSIVEKNGILALEDSSSNLENYMFGDVAIVLELYNLVSQIFHKKIKKSKTKKKAKDSDLLKIDLNQFIFVFNCYSKEGKAYFVKIVQNILKFFIFREKIFGYRFPFNYFFNYISFDPCLLQELTRYVLNIVAAQIDYHETNSEWDLLYSQENLIKSLPLIKELATNYSEEPFGDFGSMKKLELLRLLCENFLLTRTFENFKIFLEEDIEKNKIKLKQFKNEISDIFVDKNAENPKRTPNPIKMAKRISSRPNVKGKLTKYERLNTRIKNQTELFEKINRLEPIGVVANNVFIWNFSFVNGIVVEFRKNEKSEWFILDNAESIQAVIDFLKKGLNNPILCKKLKEIKENLSKIKPIDNSDQQSEESESDGEKIEKKYSLRNADKSLVKHESSESEDSQEEELEAHLKTLDSKTRMKFMKKLASVSAKFEWIESNDLSCSIDNLLKYLIKQVGKAYYYGLTNEAVFRKIIKIITAYSNEIQFMEKFKIIKKTLVEFTELIGYHHIKYLLQKTGKILPNGKKLLDILKEFIDSCQSLSALYLMTYFLMSSVKWTNFRSMKPCSLCKENYDETEFQAFVNEKILVENDLSSYGYYNCFRCFMPTHKRCETLKEDKLNFICQSCIDKKKFFDKESSHDEEDEIEIPSPAKVIKGGKMLRNTKKINYKQEDRIKYDEDSKDTNFSNNSNSSSFEKYSRKVHNSLTPRFSSRLKNTTKKNYSDN